MNLHTSIERQVETTRQTLTDSLKQSGPQAKQDVEILEVLVEAETGEELETDKKQMKVERFENCLKRVKQYEEQEA